MEALTGFCGTEMPSSTDMEALTGFGGMGFGGTDIGGGGSWRFVDFSHIVSSKTHPRRGCLSVEKGARSGFHHPR
ncbi:MAG: hypothetical protein K5890_11910 [Bacteroidales bacterium]|nr:hypothetical protein [Bacteroidales bacterium]